MATTPADERARIIADFSAGHLTAITNVDVFTVGFDVPEVDLIAMLRPTMSPGLFVQMAGRGTRLAPDKKNCVLLDFAGNVARHGPVDTISGRTAGKSAAPIKECLSCASLVPLGSRVCPDCGYAWPEREAARPRQPQHAGSADTLAPMGQQLTWLPVRAIEFFQHFKADRPPSLRMDVYTSSTRVNDWMAFEHGGGARHYAAVKWRALGGREPIPLTASEGLRRRGELAVIREIGVRRDGQYWQIVSLRKSKLEVAS
jgi:DNA repair protein RadD